MSWKYKIEIISAPSILGLKPTGVEKLGESLLAAGLAEKLKAAKPVIQVKTLNNLYTDKREPATNVLNAVPIRNFSLTLGKIVSGTIKRDRLAFVLGGDCSILIGIMSALKANGPYGLVFFDAHADFYEPEKSITGEVADMDLAIITGRGPDLLTNIDNLGPYVNDENVIHIGQRDGEETEKYESRDVRKTGIKCFDLAAIMEMGIANVTKAVLEYIDRMEVKGLWVHFDADVLSDEINPAVDYRLPGGLLFEQTEYLLSQLLLTGKIAGISVTIFNPKLDENGLISKSIVASFVKSLAING
jgi:arginase